MENQYNASKYSKKNSAIDMAKPWLRGYFHQAAFFVTLGAGVVLCSFRRDERAFVSCLIYLLSLCAMLGVSALYHRIHWEPHARMWMRRLDHSAIFVSIAGTATPVAMLAINDGSGVKLLVTVWIAALFGIVQSLFWVKAPKWLTACLYVGVGWICVPYLSEIKKATGVSGVVFLLLGGVVYSLGALVYALKRPNPWPKIFGYHEIFHVLVVVAAVFHFIVIARLVV